MDKIYFVLFLLTTKSYFDINERGYKNSPHLKYESEVFLCEKIMML